MPALTQPNQGTSLRQYGYDEKTGQALAQSLGLTTDQLLAALNTTPTNIIGAQASPGGTTGQYGNSIGSMAATQDNTGSTISQLQLLKSLGITGGNQQSGQAPSSRTVPVSQDPMNAATNLGAAALNMPAIYNPTPSQIPAGAKGGVAQVASPTSSDAVPTVPQGPWTSTPGVFTSSGQAAANQLYQQYGGGQGTPASVAAFYKGMTGQEVPTGANVVAPTAGGTPTPVMPANAAVARTAPPTPFATAPPAPGIDVAAHNNALENAGKTLFAHFGGDPSTATHADISNFHSQLTGMLGAQTGAAPFGPAPSGAANYTAGVNQPPSALQPAKMAAGGLVPGRGNQDTVPALLTPGEYVIPQQQAAQIFGGRQPVRMASGGFVPEDDSNDDDSPPEVRRKRLTVPNAPAATQQGVQGGQSGQASTPAPAAPGDMIGGIDWNKIAQARQAQQARQGWNAMGTNAYQAPVGSNAMTVGDVGPNTNIPGAGVTQSLGTAPPANATAMGAASAIGGLASGLSAAAKTYADSIKSWQWQPQQFSAPPAPSGPAAQFTQLEVDHQKKKKLASQFGYPDLVG